MIKVQNNYHKKLTFPIIGITIDAQQIKVVNENVATKLLTNKWISQVNNGDNKGRRSINKKVKFNK